MAIYYRGPELNITDKLFVLRAREPYLVQDLRDIRVIALKQTWRREVFELRATYQGREVLLYRTTDRTMFAHVRRALVRALEANAMHSLAEEQRTRDALRGGTLTAAGGTTEPPRDPWLDPADPSSSPPGQAPAEPRWRTIVERLLGLPLTTAGAMTVAAERFDDRMTRILVALGDPEGRSR
ncbi:hypothetical protein KBX50_03410 [Micromonospora sp. C51]|uniref:DUF6232 family protein n=1 Tax=Micromonospora sp. C51 TaxID=2824879 RepID=UPI001B36FF25|nr:DUF6232 family protein [Micromonospora sp. C51]MBQ1047536.1 hypothetical protein [Micromonospora sp. C51]